MHIVIILCEMNRVGPKRSMAGVQVTVGTLKSKCLHHGAPADRQQHPLTCPLFREDELV